MLKDIIMALLYHFFLLIISMIMMILFMNLFKSLILVSIIKLLVILFVITLYFWTGGKLDIKKSTKLDFLTVSSIAVIGFIFWFLCLIYTGDGIFSTITEKTSSYWGLSNIFNFPSIIVTSICFNYTLDTPFKNLLMIFPPSIIMYIAMKFKRILLSKKHDERV